MENFKENAVQMELPAEWLYGNPHNPFRVVDDAQMEELAESIHRLGVLTPLMVRPTGQSGVYEIISGHPALRLQKSRCGQNSGDRLPGGCGYGERCFGGQQSAQGKSLAQ